MRQFYVALFLSFMLHANAQQMQWVKQFTGPGQVGLMGTSVAVDAENNVYTTGYFSGTVDFDPGPGVYNLSTIGNNTNTFVSKLDSSGNFVWAKQIVALTQNGNSYAMSLSLDAERNIYITGAFGDTLDFDPGIGVYALYSGIASAFIMKLNNSGNFVWAKQLELKTGFYGVTGYAIAVDGKKNVFTIGEFRGTTDFDPSPGTYNLIPLSGNDVFVHKLDSNGSFCWVKQIGGTSNAYWSNAMGLALDEKNNIYITATFLGTRDFDPGPGVDTLTSHGAFDIFLCKLDYGGNFCWAKAIGGGQDDEAMSIAICKESVYSTGYFRDNVDFDPGPGINYLSGVGASDVYVSKLDTAGNFIWAKKMGGGSYYAGECGNSIVANSKMVFVTGAFCDTANFDPGQGLQNLVSNGGGDIFVCQLDSLGNFICAEGMGGMGIDNALSVAIDSRGEIHVTGFVTGTADMDPGPGVYDLMTDSNSYSAFISKMSPCANITNVIENSSNLFSVRPNPSDGRFCVSIGEQPSIIIFIYSLTGNLVEKKVIFKDTEFDLTSYEKGMYFMEAIIGLNKTRKKIVIE